MRRRALLHTLGTSSLAAFCAGCLGATGQSGEGTTVEIIPNNRTDEEVTVDVSVYSTDGTQLLEHTYTLRPGHSDESQGVRNDVGYVTVSTTQHGRVRHEYDPDAGLDCDGQDVQILVNEDAIDFAYTC